MMEMNPLVFTLLYVISQVEYNSHSNLKRKYDEKKALKESGNELIKDDLKEDTVQ